MKRECKVVGRTTYYLSSYPPHGQRDTIAQFSYGKNRRAIRKADA